MTIFRVIPKGDIALTPRDPVTGKRSAFFLSGAQAVKQRIATRLRFFLGEWFLDLREGLPHYTVVFVKNPNLDLIRTIFRKTILSMPEVKGLPTINLVYDSKARKLAVEFDVTLITGGTLSVRQPDPPFIIDIPRAA